VIKTIKMSNLLEHFIIYCKDNFGSESKMKYEEWLDMYANMFVEDDILICKDVVCDLLKIRSDHLKEVIEKNEIEYKKYNYNNLPKKAIIKNKKKIKQSRKEVCFFDVENFMIILLSYRNEENKKLVVYFVKMNKLSREFLIKYGECMLMKYENGEKKILELEERQKEVLKKYKKQCNEIMEKDEEIKDKNKALKRFGYNENTYIDYLDYMDNSEDEELDDKGDRKTKDSLKEQLKYYEEMERNKKQ
jgi:hypothetical protein